MKTELPTNPSLSDIRNKLDKLTRHSLDFQQYEIDLVLQGLDALRENEYRRCKWEMQPSGQYYYTPNRAIKQIEFIKRSIKRQMGTKKEA